MNDWTSPNNEPTLTSLGAFIEFVVWLYNLAITYSDKRKAPSLHDTFPEAEHNPNVAGMYLASFNGHWCINTGQTFGENTSPSNFDILAQAGKEMSQAKWFDNDIVDQAAAFIPQIAHPAPLTSIKRASMTTATCDSVNQGVLDPTNCQLPPAFSHHVYDNMYSNSGIASLITCAASVSIIGAYEVFGYPQDLPLGPNLITWEKFPANATRIDKPVGYGVDLHHLIY